MQEAKIAWTPHKKKKNCLSPGRPASTQLWASLSIPSVPAAVLTSQTSQCNHSYGLGILSAP